MARVRVSTTVDSDILAKAREIRAGTTDSALLDEALETMVSRHRAHEIDAAYVAYEAQPLDLPDEWGDLASFRATAAET